MKAKKEQKDRMGNGNLNTQHNNDKTASTSSHETIGTIQFEEFATFFFRLFSGFWAGDIPKSNRRNAASSRSRSRRSPRSPRSPALSPSSPPKRLEGPRKTLKPLLEEPRTPVPPSTPPPVSKNPPSRRVSHSNAHGGTAPPSRRTSAQKPVIGGGVPHGGEVERRCSTAGAKRVSVIGRRGSIVPTSVATRFQEMVHWAAKHGHHHKHKHHPHPTSPEEYARAAALAIQHHTRLDQLHNEELSLLATKRALKNRIYNNKTASALPVLFFPGMGVPITNEKIKDFLIGESKNQANKNLNIALTPLVWLRLIPRLLFALEYFYDDELEVPKPLLDAAVKVQNLLTKLPYGAREGFVWRERFQSLPCIALYYQKVKILRANRKKTLMITNASAKK